MHSTKSTRTVENVVVNFSKNIAFLRISHGPLVAKFVMAMVVAVVPTPTALLA